MNYFWILAGISLAFNLFAVWYVRELLIRFSHIGDSAEEIYSSVEEYEKHLASVYDLPLFYGDNTLKGLLTHTQDIKEQVQIYKEMFSLQDPDSYPTIEEEEASDG